MNSYNFYVKVCKEEGMDKKNVLSHHDFRKKVAIAWINPDLCWNDEVNGPVKNAKKRKVLAVVDENSIDSRKSRRSRESRESSVYVGVSIGEEKLRCAKVTDDAFKPGSYLSIRLDSSRHHLPDDAKKCKVLPT